MNLERLASELIRALRGRRSQRAVSRRLGFATNVVYPWESGRRFPTTGTFLRLASRSRVDVRLRLGEFLGAPVHQVPERNADVADLLKRLTGENPATDLAARIGLDRGTLGRWLHGKTQPRLPELLSAVEACTRRLLDFLALFADPETLPSARDATHDLRAQRRLAYELPWSHAVLRALELEGNRRGLTHENIARSIGLGADETRALLEELERAKQLSKRGACYAPGRVLTVDTRPDPEGNRALKIHWAKVALERLEEASALGQNLFSYNLFAVDEEGLSAIRRAHVEYFERVRSIVAECTAPERVVLLNLQLLALGERQNAPQ